MTTSPAPLGVILAGGLARRMGGGDKALLALGGRPILARVIARLGPQCDGLVLSANGDPGRFPAFDGPVVADDLPGFPGPLAGVLAALDWAAANRPEVERIVTVSGDTPFLPCDLVARLAAAETALACAVSGGRMHPVVALWTTDLRLALRSALVEEGLRKVGAFADRHGAARVAWSDAPIDPFLNVNTPEDLARAEHLLARHGEP